MGKIRITLLEICANRPPLLLSLSAFVCFVSCFRWFSRDVTNRRLTSAPLGECMRKLQLLVRLCIWQ